ncbi:MAG: hypothetical protein ACOC3I_06260 [Verrucomicrobiota bacterium]
MSRSFTVLRLRRTLPLFACLFGSMLHGAGLNLFPRSWGDVIVNTDMTPAGRELVLPTPESPVFYRGQSLGNRFGATPGDRQPTDAEMGRVVAEILQGQGYRPAVAGTHEPSLFLVLQWGLLRPGRGDLAWFLGYRAADDIGAASFPGALGPEVFRRNFRTRTVETLLQAMREPLYGVIITAFDYASASTDDPVVYWQTRIGLSARGKSMEQALPAMVAAAGPSIGRETKAPVLRDPDETYEGYTRPEALELLEVLDENTRSGSP